MTHLPDLVRKTPFKKPPTCIYVFVFILLCMNTVMAGETPVFRTVSPEGGFYYDGVKSIQQDHEGFIWVVMDNSLYRFDGYDYKSYYFDFLKSDHSSRWIFHKIVTDKEGKLYVATSNGLYEYDRSLDTFIKLIDSNIEYVKTDNFNNIWIKSNKQLSLLNTDNNTLYTPLYDGEPIPYIGNVFCPHNEDLYVFTNYSKAYRYNYQEKEFNFSFYLPSEDGLVIDAKIFKGKLWLLIDKYGIYKIDLATYAVEENFNFLNETKERNPSRALHIDKNGLIWIGTMKGLYILNPETKEYSLHQHSKTDPFTLPDNSVWTIAEDEQKNLWIGTYSGGLCYVNLDEKLPFTTFWPQDKQLSSAPVSAFAEDDNNIWIGTEGGGINRLNKSTMQFTYYTHNSSANSLAYDNIKSLLIDKKNRLWISMYNGGLDRFDIQKNQFYNYKKNLNEDGLQSDNLRKIVLEADSGMWIAYQEQNSTFSYYSFEHDKFTQYNIENNENDYYIFDILRGRDNKLWILSYQKLYEMNLKDYSIQAVSIKDSLYLHGRTLCMDDSGNIWIGTTGRGLIKYNPSSKKHIFYEEILQYGAISIYSICSDDEGSLWMGTDNGLFKFNIASGKFYRFDKNDGVQGQVYYPLATLKGWNSELYMGSTSGFTIINPRLVVENTYRPRAIISDFYIENKPTRFDGKDDIILNHDQTNFGFKFSSDNYMVPQKTTFRYRLKGYDERWIETNASNRIAFYSKVPPGTYVFEVLAGNNGSIWSETPAVIKIQCNPAPWLSGPAYIVYMFTAILILLLIVRYYNQQKRLKLRLYLDSLEKNKKEEIHQSQLRFFTNISHDFRTPLSLIIGVLGKLKQEGIKEHYYKILYNNAQRLLSLVNELMEFRSIENGKKNLHLEQADINNLVGNIASDFKNLANQRKIDFNIRCDLGLSNLFYIDRQVVEKIIMNLLNNAFKYTKDGGTISIETYCEADSFKSQYKNSYTVKDATETGEYFLIAVRDTGVGISKESIKNIFERFYKVNTVNTESHLGTGIGLALVKSMVLLHKGKISIFSEREEGTDFVVYLPADTSVYRKDDFAPAQNTSTFADEAETTENSYNEKAGLLLRNKKRILIVEDNKELRTLLTDYLSSFFEIVEAENGVEASELLCKMEIDLVLSDIMMPEKDGITLSREIKSNLETSHIPVILLTAKTGVDSKIEGAQAGADLYFEKPIDFNLLLITINNTFDHQKRLKEYYAKNYFVESPELSANEQDNKFLKRFIEILDENINQPELDVNFLASELTMSRSKLYLKIKALTDKSIIEFILNYRLRKAARIIVEENISMRQVMERIGMESQSYFTNTFKKEFGETPSAFAARHRNK